jgi:hypothetical protein
MKHDQMHQWAKAGAANRLQQLDVERTAILTAFPGLRAARATTAADAASPIRKRRTMSPAARAKIAAAAKRRWAAWRKAKAKE